MPVIEGNTIRSPKSVVFILLGIELDAVALRFLR